MPMPVPGRLLAEFLLLGSETQAPMCLPCPGDLPSPSCHTACRSLRPALPWACSLWCEGRASQAQGSCLTSGERSPAQALLGGSRARWGLSAQPWARRCGAVPVLRPHARVPPEIAAARVLQAATGPCSHTETVQMSQALRDVGFWHHACKSTRHAMGPWSCSPAGVLPRARPHGRRARAGGCPVPAGSAGNGPGRVAAPGHPCRGGRSPGRHPRPQHGESSWPLGAAATSCHRRSHWIFKSWLNLK